MDVSRAVLDNLMGRDRNKALDSITERDHYSNPDVSIVFIARCASLFLYVSVLTRFSPTPLTIKALVKNATTPT